MAQAENNRRSKRAQVLRAADVIPPFDKDVSPVKGPASSEAAGQQPPREPKTRRTPEARLGGGDRGLAAGPADLPDVPTYDLGENILAEQRQAASRRRKAPGQAETAARTQPERAAVTTHVVEPPSQEVAELQRIVAEIVARDIERLCRQPSRPPHGSSRIE